jgi:LysM repeat protein
MQTYIVKTGDTLSKISQTFYGNWSGVDAIAKANGITNVNLIYPGMTLSIPDRSSATNSSAAVVEDAVVVDSKPTSRKPLWWILIGVAAAGTYLYYRHKRAPRLKDKWKGKKAEEATALSGPSRARKRKKRKTSR